MYFIGFAETGKNPNKMLPTCLNAPKKHEVSLALSVIRVIRDVSQEILWRFSL